MQRRRARGRRREAALTHALRTWPGRMVGLAALHVAAALKHHFFDRDEVLAHMVPGLRAPFESAPPPSNPVRLGILGVGLGADGGGADGRADLRARPDLGGPPPRRAQQRGRSRRRTSRAGARQRRRPHGDDRSRRRGRRAAWRVDQRASSIGFGFTYRRRMRRRALRRPLHALARRHPLRSRTISTLLGAWCAIETGLGGRRRGRCMSAALPTEPWFNVAATRPRRSAPPNSAIAAATATRRAATLTHPRPEPQRHAALHASTSTAIGAVMNAQHDDRPRATSASASTPTPMR